MPTKPAADVFNHYRDFGGESFIHMFDTLSRIDKTLSFMITLILINKLQISTIIDSLTCYAYCNKVMFLFPNICLCANTLNCTHYRSNPL